jgi:hypothetical protein
MWATPHPNWASYSTSTFLQFPKIELRGTLLSYAAPPYRLAHPSELRCTLLSYAVLYPTQLLCTLLSYAVPCELRYTLTDLPTVLVLLWNFLKCRNNGLSGTGIRVPLSGTGKLRYRIQMMEPGIPMPVKSASMPMSIYTCAKSTLTIPFLTLNAEAGFLHFKKPGPF